MKRAGLLCFLFLLLLLACQKSGKDRISFNQDIRPILNENCMHCHGGVRAMGGFNLLFEATALDSTESGKPAIIPGNHRQSALYQRITALDPEIRMPLEADALDKEEIALIARWIDEGAKWEKHWAYLRPEKNTSPPRLNKPMKIRNEIDRFTFSKLERLNLSPNPEASKVSLLRRLYFDLTGLPPSPKEAKDFLEDDSPEAYEKLIDRLLNSPHFGERWAVMWLDLARYADTKGYEKDSNRSIWKYRDWVINAFNQDMPFDQFTIKQLAGDLLPDPREDQLIATAFHRNSIANDEGGTDDETFRIASVIERIGTTYEVWQSTTMACAQCHSHPYDPFLQEDFYRSMAFFNNAEDRDIYNEQPKLFSYSPENAEKVKSIINWIETKLKPEHQVPSSPFLYERRSGILQQLDYRVVEAEEFYQSSHLIELIRPDQDMLWQIQDSSWIYFRDVDLSEVERIGFRVATMLDFAGTITVHLDRVDGPVIGTTQIHQTGKWDGWQWRRPSGEELFEVVITPILPTYGKHDLYFTFGMGDTYIQHLFYLDKIIYYEKNPGKDQYGSDFREKLEQLAAVPTQTTPIIQEIPPERARTTRIFKRGNWLTPGDTVSPGIPGIYVENTEYAPKDRLAFARWLVSPDNPLTARVIVNRIWEQIFGNGLVGSMEEFGSQGDKPTHPGLLDWLAIRLMEDHQWQLKPLIREIVSSATYRQDSRANSQKLEKDPENKWLSRGSRARLSAEQIRDQILALGGLLDRHIGGPSVLLPELGIGEADIPQWAVRHQEGTYRRSLYTFWKRTDPFPDMITFDSPDRAMCNSQRIPTNTPLQALTLLNDEIYFEAASALAGKIHAAYPTPRRQITAVYQDLLFKPIAPKKLILFEQLYEQSRAHFQLNEQERNKIVPEKGYDDQEKIEIAALSVVINALLNLDELLVKS